MVAVRMYMQSSNVYIHNIYICIYMYMLCERIGGVGGYVLRWVAVCVEVVLVIMS